MMTEGSDASPKGVADVEVSLDSVANKIRDRRDAVMEGKVTPNFPNVAPRQSLVSIDDEEIKTYRIEITTDNVVKQSVPARFSESEAEEYVAEFDMVDTKGEVIVPPPQIARARTPKESRARESAKGGHISLFNKFGSRSKEESSLKSGSTKKEKNSVNLEPKARAGGPLAALRKRTYSLEEPKKEEEGKLGEEGTEASSQDAVAMATPPQAETTVRDAVETPTPPAENETTTTDTKPEESTAAEMTSDTVSTPKPAEVSTADSVEEAEGVEVQVETKPSMLRAGGLFASLRKRTHSGKSSLTKNRSPPRATPKYKSSPRAIPKSSSREIHHPPGEVKSKQDTSGGLAETSNVGLTTPVSTPTRTTSDRAASPKVSTPIADNKSAPEQTSESTPVDLDESIMPSVANEPGEGDAKEGKVDAKLPQDDDTKSMTTSSSESIRACKPPMKIPGEAAVERVLEKFFEKVTCTCITDRCVMNDEKELPNYMVVEINKVHQKAQAKKAEIAEKKQARRASKKSGGSANSSLKGSVKGSVKKQPATPTRTDTKTEKKTAEKEAKGKSLFEMTRSTPPRKPVPHAEWGEKISEQDSFTTAETPKPTPPAGFTVSAFIKEKLGMTEKSAPKEVSDDEESEVVEESVVEDAEKEEDSVDHLMNGAILNISSIDKDDMEAKESAPSTGTRAMYTLAPTEGKSKKDAEERVIILSRADDDEDGSESLLDAADDDEDDGGDSLLDDDEASEYTTELIQVDFDPSKLGNTTDADMYLAREVLRRYAEITGISLDELIEDVVDESLASLTLDAYGFPMDREGSVL